MIEITPLTIDLEIGHTTKPSGKSAKPVTHTRVTFGQRINGKRLFAIDEDPQSAIPTQYSDLLLREAITEFGDLKIPVALTVLLNLDSIDRDDLNAAFNRFSVESLGGRKFELLEGNKVKLAIGYERNGLIYDVVEFGQRLTGMSEVEADRLKLSSIRRNCYLAGQQVVKLLQSKGSSVLEGPMPLEYFERMDVVDIEAIRAASEVWRNSFRRASARV